MKLNNNRGVTLVDISIALIIITLFISLISGLFYNYTISNRKVERKIEATYQAINILEKVKIVGFEKMSSTLENKEKEKDNSCYELKLEDLNSLLPESEKMSSTEGYGDLIQIEECYTDDENGENVMIKVTAIVEYTVGKKEGTDRVELNTILVKENGR